MSNLNRPLMRVCTAGSVDDGKSTLIGRLLLETQSLYDDHIKTIESESLAFVTDGLKAEREQGITIDVAYRFFSTKKRQFILADTPGHTQYTRNMATGASLADLTLLLIDASKGLTEQSKRHATITSLLGVKRLCVVVNKMDLIDFKQSTFLKLKNEFSDFATKLDITEIQFIPTSALEGDNITTISKKMPWHKGTTLLSHLENVFFEADSNLIDFRYPIQYVIYTPDGFRGYCGQIASGSIKVGDKVTLLPSMQKSKVKSLHLGNKELSYAKTPQSVTLTLTDDVDLSRGDQIVKSNNIPHKDSIIESLVIWLDQEELNLQSKYLLKIGSEITKTHIKELNYSIDVNTLKQQDCDTLKPNDIGRLTLHCEKALYWDSYDRNRKTGNFILIDSINNRTVAAGMIIDRNPSKRLSFHIKTMETTNSAKNITASPSQLSTESKRAEWTFKPQTLWLTGLPASGKSTLSNHLEQKIFEFHHQVQRLDGDNLRFGINRDLGFSPKDRSENIRRTAELAKILNDAGISVIVSLISPYEKDRQAARSIIGKDNYIEVFVNTPLDVCEKRDPKGLYQKARSGQIQNFTGIDGIYECPVSSHLSINTADISIDESCSQIFAFYLERSKK